MRTDCARGANGVMECLQVSYNIMGKLPVCWEEAVHQTVGIDRLVAMRWNECVTGWLVTSWFVNNVLICTHGWFVSRLRFGLSWAACVVSGRRHVLCMYDPMFVCCPMMLS